MSICDLPDEILLLVNDYLSLDDYRIAQEERFRLLRVCRHWHSLFFSQAWKSIYLEDKHIYPVVCATQRNPKIGSFIRCLDVNWSFWWHGATPESVPEIDSFREIVDETSHSKEHSEEWLKALQERNPDAWLALFVPSLKGVTSLCLQFSHSPTYFMPIVARAAAREKPFDLKPIFQRLENVTVKMEDDNKAFYCMNDLLPFFSFPSMQTFSGNTVCEESGWTYQGYPALEPGKSGVKKIDFGTWGTCNGENGFAGLITLCKELESFEYQHDDQVVWGESSCPFRPGPFYASLCNQKHSLREIRLNNNGTHTWDFDPDYQEEGFELGQFGSMTEFKQLRELRIPWGTLMQVNSDERPTVLLSEILPASLEYLSLSECRQKDLDMVVAGLRGVLEHREERFPNLRLLEILPFTLNTIFGKYGISMVDDRSVPQSTIDTFAPLQISCQEMGIEFRFFKDGTHDLNVIPTPNNNSDSLIRSY